MTLEVTRAGSDVTFKVFDSHFERQEVGFLVIMNYLAVLFNDGREFLGKPQAREYPIITADA